MLAEGYKAAMFSVWKRSDQEGNLVELSTESQKASGHRPWRRGLFQRNDEQGREEMDIVMESEIKSLSIAFFHNCLIIKLKTVGIKQWFSI